MTHQALQPLHIPAEFWDLPAVTTAIGSRNFHDLFHLITRKLGVTQTKLASTCGLTHNAISHMMRPTRTRQPSTYDVIDRIATGLNMPDHHRIALGLAPCLQPGSQLVTPPSPVAEPDRHPAAVSVESPEIGGDTPRLTFPYTDAMRRRTMLATALGLSAAAVPFPLLASSSILDELRQLRRGMDDVIDASPMSGSALDDWEQTALRLGLATRYRPAALLLAELTTDLVELRQRMLRLQPMSAMRRLMVVTAQMAGLMSLTLIKLNYPDESRQWARTARVAADEAGQPAVRAWVGAQDAYAHFYAGSLVSAVHAARRAQLAAAGKPCVGVALAAALEARAHAALGDAEQTRACLRRAEDTLAGLSVDEVLPSAFGYDEAQLRFHEGNAYTHLHDTAAAWTAQQRALALYPSSDYLDRALTKLDRACCLAHDGDVSTALTYATSTMLDLSDQQRAGLITSRGQQILSAIPPRHRALSPAREFREIVMSTTRESEPECFS